MKVEIRGYVGYILDMVKNINNEYEIMLETTRGDVEIRLHRVKPTEIKVLNNEEE